MEKSRRDLILIFVISRKWARKCKDELKQLSIIDFECACIGLEQQITEYQNDIKESVNYAKKVYGINLSKLVDELTDEDGFIWIGDQ